MKPSFPELLDEIARPHIPEELDLYPRLMEVLRQERRAPLWRIWRYHPVAAVLLALLILAALAGVAYALGSALGYIPGVGVIQQDATLRILEQPVSLTRQGITLTVHQAVLSSDKSVVLFSVEGVPWEALSHEEDVPGCSGQAYLHLPDGSELQLIGGGGSPHESRFIYAPISPEINELTFVMPCILGTLPGKAPENWELPLRFVPAPPDMGIAEVVDLSTPSPLPQRTAPASSAEPRLTPEATLPPTPFQLRRVVEYADGYIFLLTFTNLPQDDGSEITAFMSTVEITDARGDAVFALHADDLDFSDVPEEVDMVWAYRVAAGDIAWPLRFAVQSYRLLTIPSQASFAFDAGPNPQPGQEWQFNLEEVIEGIPVRLESVRFTGQGYDFTFATSPQVESIAIEIPGTQPVGGGGGGDGQGVVFASLEYAGNPPVGEITLAITALVTRSPGPVYEVSWAPEGFQAGSAAPSPYGIQLLLEQSIPLEEGYYLMGTLNWEEARLSEVRASVWDMELSDAQGQTLPIEPAHADEVGLSETTPAQWVARVYGRPLRAPLTLRLNRVEVTFSQPILFKVDLSYLGFSGASQQLGNAWKLGLLPLDLPGYAVQLRTLRFVRQGDLQGFEFTWEAPPVVQGIEVTFEDGVVGGQGHSGGGSGRGEDGLLRSYALTDGELSDAFTFAVRQIVLAGTWEATWIPQDADPNAPPFSPPQACASIADWQMALAQPSTLPAGLGGKVIVFGHRGDQDYRSTPPDFSAFIADLDGSNRQELPRGVWYALSPHADVVAYSTEDGLHLYDLNSAADRFLPGTQPGDYHALWSPQGDSLAFVRSTEADIYLYHLETHTLQPITRGAEYEALVGWGPHADRLYYTVPEGEQAALMVKDLRSGAEQRLFAFDDRRGGYAAISPEADQAAYIEKVIGELAGGLFLSRLDGSQSRLMLQLDNIFLSTPLWSREGNWLLVTVHPPYIFIPKQMPALLNLETCALLPLPWFNGEVLSWVMP